MKRILLFIIVTLLAISAEAQTKSYFEAGLSGSYGSNEKKPSLPEIYAGYGIKVAEFSASTVQARAQARYSKTPQYADLFTRDDNPERHATGELNLRAGLRWNLANESYFKPFVEGGAEYARQFGLPSAPQSALNPAFTFGTKVGYGYEVGYTRLFDDRLNRSKLRGDRIGASYLFKLSGKLHFKVGAEGEYVSYRACSNVDCDSYREYDWAGRGFVGLSIF